MSESAKRLNDMESICAESNSDALFTITNSTCLKSLLCDTRGSKPRANHDSLVNDNQMQFFRPVDADAQSQLDVARTAGAGDECC